jgi:tetratricopeptide (TPR) repeat protein
MDERRFGWEDFVRAFDAARAAVPPPLGPGQLGRVCRHLDRLPPARLPFWVANSRRAGRPQVVAALLRSSEAQRQKDPAEMLRLAKLAAAVAEALPPAVPAEVRADARAEAWAGVAEAYRVLGKLRRATAAWAAVDATDGGRTSDPSVEVKIARLRGHLLRDRHRFPEASAAYRRALRVHIVEGNNSQIARTLLSIGLAEFNSGELEEAIRAVHWSLRLLDDYFDAELKLAGLVNLILMLDEAGHAAEAAGYLERLIEMYREEEVAPRMRLRLRWLEGRLLGKSGHRIQARVALSEVLREFLERKLPFDAALVALELAAFYAEDGAVLEVERLAEEMYPVFVSGDLPRQATAVLMLFVEAVNRREASAEAIRRILRRFGRQRRAKG